MACISDKAAFHEAAWNTFSVLIICGSLVWISYMNIHCILGSLFLPFAIFASSGRLKGTSKFF